MEKEIFEYLLNYGVLGIIAIMFLWYVKKEMGVREQERQKDREEQKEFMKEMLDTLTLLKYRIVNDYVSKEGMQLMAKLRVRYIMSSYKHMIILYIIKNNIQQNFKSIQAEIENFISNCEFRTIEIFKNKMRLDDIQIINSKIQKEMIQFNQELLIPIFEELSQKGEHTKEENEILIRELENHFERVTENLIKSMDSLE